MARTTGDRKAETRRRIIATASERFKTDGIDGSGIATLMADAGLTNGAFYAHFSSKDDLVAHAVGDQLRRQRDVLSALPPGRASLEGFIRGYLSSQHRDDPGAGCPNAALLDEIGRCGAVVRETYTQGMTSIVEVIAAHLSPRDPRSRDEPPWGCSPSWWPACSSRVRSPTRGCPTTSSPPGSTTRPFCSTPSHQRLGVKVTSTPPTVIVTWPSIITTCAATRRSTV